MPRMFAWLAWLALSPLASPPTASDHPQPTSFARDVAPILHTHCVRCHGDKDPSGGLRLDGYDAVLRGGERGPIVVARVPLQSLLYRKITRQDRPFMPPKKTLAAHDTTVIRLWIETGAAP